MELSGGCAMYQGDWGCREWELGVQYAGGGIGVQRGGEFGGAVCCVGGESGV